MSYKKLEILFVSELVARQIVNGTRKFENDTILYNVIQAIKKVKELYYEEFNEYL